MVITMNNDNAGKNNPNLWKMNSTDNIEKSIFDIQIGGDHYKSCKIQPVEFIEANNLKFLEGCVVKRVTRYNKPTGKGRHDIEKAIHELQLLLELRHPIDEVKT
jgi:hypothetical protein